MKYKKGDRVRIVSGGTKNMSFNGIMVKYLGTVMTVKEARETYASGIPCYYKMVEDDGKWFWYDNMIVGLASETPFDFGAWKDKNVSMHCRTREEAEDFCNEMHKAGLTWSSGTSYLKMSCFNIYENYTCYRFNEGEYDNTVHAKNKGYTILEWSEYRSTEPPKEEQEKIMETKIDDKPLSYQEAMKISRRMCKSYEECGGCPLDYRLDDNDKTCWDALRDDSNEVEKVMKKWAAEHPVKTNRDKFVEVFGEIERFGKCEIIDCSTVPCLECGWWNREYVEPDKAKVE